jgi:kynurenine formamidase
MTKNTKNWGRWGDDDERGTLNLVTSERVLSALQVCRTGKVYSLALPLDDVSAPVLPHRPAPSRYSLTSSTDDWLERIGAEPGVGSNQDVLVLASHASTHMDALSHVFTAEGIYNGFPRDDFSTMAGAPHCDIRATGTFAGRGILLDLPRHQGVEWLEPGHAVGAGELEACAAAQGTEVRAGDILLVRTGWLDMYASGEHATQPGQPGLGLDALPFIDDHEIAAVGVDNTAVEVTPFDQGRIMCGHIEMLVQRGLTLLEHLRLSELAADRCYEFFLSVGALPVTGATGSPVNPVAIG